jgi:hypothetical protein
LLNHRIYLIRSDKLNYRVYLIRSDYI